MDKAHKATDKRLEVMERELAAIYREAQKGISDKATAYFEQFIKQDEKKKALVADGKLSEDEYLQWRKNKILYSKRFVTLQGQITGELARVNQTAAAYINDQLPDVYALNYNYVGKGVQRAVKGYSFTLIDANTVKRLATKTDGLLPKRKVDVPKDKLWNAKKMRTQVLQGILQGESMDKIADRMQTVTDMNGVSAIRNARTMVTGAENAGRIDMMHKAATDGVIMRKRWIATTDSRTRDWHRDLDGVEVDMDEPFQNDFGDIMFPGDPTADGANVYNCRCALGYRVVGFGKAQVENNYQDSNNLPQKPIRPKKKDYATEEEYFKVREKYKVEKEEYEKKISDVVNSNLSRKREYGSVESLKNWAKNKGIKVDDSVGVVDVRAFDDYIMTTDKLFAKYPQVLRWYKEQGYSYTLDTITDVGTLANAGHGFSFGRLFSNYENVLQEYTEAITSGGQVRGDGTIAGLFRHEFGHELDNTIRMSMYGDLEKRKAYMSDIRSLYGKSGMSEYATVNEDEMFAEAFAEYESGSDSEFAKAFENLLRRWLK